MGKSFFNYIQPTIVRLSEDSRLPEQLRGNYFVNVNIVGIKYFTENYMLIEDGEGGYMYMLTNDGDRIKLTDKDIESVIDIPRAYIVITEDFVKSQEAFSEWVLAAIADNSIYTTGTDNFRPGTDYYINDILADYLEEEYEDKPDAVLPDYLSSDFTITEYWQELDSDTARHTNFDYFRLKNKIQGLEYSEEELDALCHTFFTVLVNCATTTDEDAEKQMNQIYAAVMNYYAEYQTDCALMNIALILNTSVNTGTQQTDRCGCQQQCTVQTTTTTLSCYDAYKQAMAQWLVKMLGDVEFYKDWMWYTDAEGNLYPNEGLIQSLILLLENFEEAGYNLSFSEKSIYSHHCGQDASSALDEANHKTIQDYIKLLNWVLEGCIDNNTNKIKVIGERFGELIPKLCF